MHHLFYDYRKSADYINEQTRGFTPEIAIVLGSGLNHLADEVESPVTLNYKDIPGFKPSTAPMHAGKLVLGRLGGKRVVCMQGRMHYYEGYSHEDAAYPVRVMNLIGAKKMIVTNAAGGVNESFAPGDLMLITGHIKFFDDSPMRGKNIEEFGPRFFDMSFSYSQVLQDVARKAAIEAGIGLREGVYFYMPGPQYETPAEIRAIRTLGGDAVGMSTVSEVIAASHAGISVLGVSLITNLAAGVSKLPLSEEEVLETAEKAKTRFSGLLLKCLELM